MAFLILKQLAILLWKSWIMRRRHWISTIFELIFPVLITIIMSYVRYSTTKGSSLDPQHSEGWKPPTYYDPRTYTISNLWDNVDQAQLYYTPINEATHGFMTEFSQKFKNITV